jgi:hypothetical protein
MQAFYLYRSPTIAALIAINRKWRESYPARIPIRWLQTTRSAAPAIAQNADR